MNAFLKHCALGFTGAALAILAGVPVIGWDLGLAKSALAAGIGAVATMILAVITPLTRAYGYGSFVPETPVSNYGGVVTK